ncbi:MAG: energy transducer TonB [Treponema sp.]|jgi:protein TonB|nr:energy transducer TonB [Treponema sp.]
MNTLRGILFLLVALGHGFLIFFLVFKMDTMVNTPEPPPRVMKMVDVIEDIPPPPPPPPPPPKPAAPQQNAVEAVAENMIETDKVPEEQVVVASLIVPQQPAVEYQELEYLPQHKVSKIPKFSDRDLRRISQYLRENYPSIPRRSGLEGLVVLELAVDSQGIIRQISVFKEDPQGRGFGEVAVKAFTGIQAAPAEANGAPVAARFRYPIRFTVR